MGNNSTPFESVHNFEKEEDKVDDISALFGDPYHDVFSFLDEFQCKVEERVIEDLFQKIAEK
ncbi:MAG: hypothetical protein JSV24_06865 [Bacteroidales bacterium]|nr:MAG: hypothetical protein JSV24_06865 [Bacteroidales bacterium]